MCVVFTSTVGVQEKAKQNKTKNKQSLTHISLEWLNNALFGKEITIGLGLDLFCNALS